MNIAYATRLLVHRLRGSVVHLQPRGTVRGNVLISYTTLPYLNTDQRIVDGHTNRWECMQMVREFLNRGYAVDVIDSTEKTFVPKKPYVYFLDVGTNMDRLSPLLNKKCMKIFHITHAHWRYQNDAEDARILAIEQKRGVQVNPDRKMAPSRAIELCDVATSIAGDFANSTYAHAGKKIFRIPLSTTHLFPSPEKKDFERARYHFMWFGGAGLALKGLDLVLEAFAAMPEYELTVCGKVSPQDPFVKAYGKELYETPNIKTLGFVAPDSEKFERLRQESLAVVFPSFSEGCAGSVILCMHAGLIPIVSRESGLDVDAFGITLHDNTVQTIQTAVRELARLPTKTLRSYALATWNYARAHHTRNTFAEAFRKVIDELESKKV